MTGVDVAAIRAELAKATPGPWKVWGMSIQTDRSGTGAVNYDEMVAATSDPDHGLRTFNAELICTLRNNADALLDEVERLRRQVNPWAGDWDSADVFAELSEDDE